MITPKTTERFKTLRNGYVFDKKIFRTGFLIIVLLLLVATAYYFQKNPFYVSCPVEANGICINPYHDNCDFFSGRLKEYKGLCEREFLFAGESYGEPIPFLLKDSSVLVFMILWCCFLFNHIKHNREWRFKE